MIYYNRYRVTIVLQKTRQISLPRIYSINFDFICARQFRYLTSVPVQTP